ncbi:hypothetical protein [Cerasicoccus frondis]|uniref:hypothetical protein n=1 Tax=Cerasicoccus frondis TaxID=490090 RepID=UPI00285256C1|nr:hypothetical protein [Cerasicoccus frondis]
MKFNTTTICLTALLNLAIFQTGCKLNEDAGEQAVLSQEPMSESTGSVTEDLNQRQQNDVDGMYNAGGLNQYEEEQMDSAIGSTGQ